MLSKILPFVACFALASAALLPAKSLNNEDTYDAHPRYTFGYDVQDAVTGDVKSQTETRDGDVVRGEYSLNDADGYRRIVQYSADAERGFMATVRREPLPTLAIATKVEAKPILLAPKDQPLKVLPVIKTYAQPAPLVRTYAAPAVIHHAPAVHLAPAAHIVHAAPAPTLIAHHAPAVVKTIHSAHPHTISYVF